MDINKWLEDSIIFEGIIGSKAYGLDTLESDTDYRGVCIPPKEYFLGLNNFEQIEQKDPDRTIFGIKKLFKLLIDCNPNIIEFMYIPAECLVKTSDFWEFILTHRGEFLSKRAKHRYTGYAMSQVKRVQSHRHWLVNPIEKKPERKDFGLPDTESLNRELMGCIESTIRDNVKREIEAILDSVADDISKVAIRNYAEFDLNSVLHEVFDDFTLPCILNRMNNMLGLIVSLGENHFSPDIMTVYGKEKSYNIAMNNWKQYNNWVTSRNPKRAELEKKFGFDTKHMGHVFRLLIQGEEIMQDQTLTVRLKPEDKEYVLSIKDGAYTYDEVLALALKRMEGFETLYTTSTLRHSPDFNKLNQLLIDTVEEFHDLN
jgi:uncharacterized protein